MSIFRPRFRSHASARAALVLAALLVVVLRHFVPFGQYVLYPLTLLTTWVHEMGHGITALLVGGSFERLEIFADASGLAHTASRPGWPSALVALGGLLAPPVVGASVLATVRGPRRAMVSLIGLVAALVISLVLWVRSMVGFVAVPGLALVVLLIAVRGGYTVRMVGAQLVAVVLALDTVTRTLGYLFISRIESGATAGRASDIAHVAQGLGGPVILWSVLVAGLAIGMLAGGLWLAARPSPVARLADELDH